MNELAKILYLPTFARDLPTSIPPNLLIKRSIALGVDIITIALIKTAIHTAYGIFLTNVMGPLTYQTKTQLLQGSLFLHISTFILIYCSYFFYSTYILEGRTLGKIAMNLRVINESFIRDKNEDYSHLSLKQSLHRAFGYFCCYLSFGTFFIFNFLSEDKRGLVDYLSDSRTVSEKWLKNTITYRQNEMEHILIDIRSLEGSRVKAA